MYLFVNVFVYLFVCLGFFFQSGSAASEAVKPAPAAIAEPKDRMLNEMNVLLINCLFVCFFVCFLVCLVLFF